MNHIKDDMFATINTNINSTILLAVKEAVDFDVDFDIYEIAHALIRRAVRSNIDLPILNAIIDERGLTRDPRDHL